MDRRDPSATPPEGPALDLGDLDWTIPPDTQPGAATHGWGSPTLGWVAQRFRHAMIYCGGALALTGLALGWWAASGRLPSADPQFGPLALILHIAAFIAAWLALRASVDTWQALYLHANRGTTPPRANLTQVVSIASAGVMCFHAAMVVSSILG
ncbi:MAG: hypothetical protein H6733_09910 [Alphaproteobacteria bacterium]|nr:hypothetical protein [Alphaproteobacteria bacterium]